MLLLILLSNIIKPVSEADIIVHEYVLTHKEIKKEKCVSDNVVAKAVSHSVKIFWEGYAKMSRGPHAVLVKSVVIAMVKGHCKAECLALKSNSISTGGKLFKQVAFSASIKKVPVSISHWK